MLAKVHRLHRNLPRVNDWTGFSDPSIRGIGVIWSLNTIEYPIFWLACAFLDKKHKLLYVSFSSSSEASIVLGLVKIIGYRMR